MLLPFVQESFLYLVKKGRLDEAYKVYSKLNPKAAEKEKEHFFEVFNCESESHVKEHDIEANKEGYQAEVEEKTNLLIKKGCNSEKDRKASLRTIYIVLMVLSFTNSYLIQGIRYILPKTLTNIFPKKVEKVNYELKVSAICELGTAILTGVLIEIPYFKRLKVLSGSVFLTSALSFGGYFFQKLLDVFACSLKPIITIQDQALEIYSSEVFETKSRVLLLSLFNIFSSVPNFVSPYLNDLFNEHDYTITYLVFGLLSAIMLVLTFLLKKETFRQTLS
jgi:hypothetical protein